MGTIRFIDDEGPLPLYPSDPQVKSGGKTSWWQEVNDKVFGVDDLSILGAMTICPTVTALRAVSISMGKYFCLTGYSTGNDGAFGFFYADTSDTTTPDDAHHVFVAGTLRLKRLDTPLTICDFGVTVANSGATNSTRLAVAIDWLRSNRKKCRAPSGTYNFASQIVSAAQAHGLELEGDGKDKTVFNHSPISADTSFIRLNGSSGALAAASIKGIGFTGTSNAAAGTGNYAIEICGLGFQHVEQCDFANVKVGVLLHNLLAGQFTEYCESKSNTYAPTCLWPLEYRKTLGDRSFHGSGMSGRCAVNSPTTGGYAAVLVGADCLPYNSPLDIQVWATSAYTIIKNNNTGSPTVHNPNWLGKITVEPFGVLVTLASGYGRTFFSGPIHAINQNIAFGVLRNVRQFVSHTDGSFAALHEDYDVIATGVTSGTAIDIGAGFWPSSIYAGAELLITLTGANYRYTHRYAVCMDGGAGGGNAATKICDLQAFNVAGWGASTFSIDGSLRLVITNASGGFNVTATISVKQIGMTQ